MSWLSDTLSSFDPTDTSATTIDSSPTVGGSVNGDSITDAIASVTHSLAGDQLRAAADRLLGTGNVVDQVYGAIAAAAPAKAPGAPSTTASTLVHYAPFIIAGVVALALVLHGRFFR